MKYDHKDYQNNPKKYELFKTATVRNMIVNQDGEVEAGTIVGIKYAGAVFNRLYNRTEPIYQLSTGDVCYANNLHSFCL
jgi:hypothetical protein